MNDLAITSRAVPEWIGKTPDSPIPPRVRDRVFINHGGRCHVSQRKIRTGEAWDVDHVIAICNGGQNRESNLAPILRGKEHKEKTAADVAEKSKTYRRRSKHNGTWPRTGRKIQSRGFARTSD